MDNRAKDSINQQPEPRQTTQAKSAKDRQNDHRVEQLRALAKETPPDHDCVRRREILAARQELEGVEHE